MKIFYKKLTGMIIFFSIILQSGIFAFAAALPVESLSAAETSDHIVLIVGHSSDKSRVTVNDYTKSQEGIWTKNWAVNGVAGNNGISKDKAEGDKKTPEGIFTAMFAFGLKENPGSLLNFHKISEGDFWVDDSESKYYNKLVNISEVTADWSSAEDMSSAAPYYNYALALDYNIEAAPYKGSAIFIHCTKSLDDKYSAGCIRIPEEYMIKLVKNVSSTTKIIILPNTDSLTEY